VYDNSTATNVKILGLNNSRGKYFKLGSLVLVVPKKILCFKRNTKKKKIFWADYWNEEVN